MKELRSYELLLNGGKLI
ncbi:hypothetical protein Golax_023055 [Gossypium laxum]|uniref:Uncharacterized protein n=1 Tax=Gossypium laxum TaxID=34288 RepID=A0A7J9B187_9ROSI|nr:hypothetical protein [Gossypium laxum]